MPDDTENKEEFPEKLAERLNQQLIEAGMIVQLKDIVSLYQDKQERENGKFWEPIKEAHPDVMKLNDTPEFNEWLNAQETPLLRLAKNILNLLPQ